MKILLILAAIYVYFVVGNLVMRLCEKLEKSFNTGFSIDSSGHRILGAMFFPFFLMIFLVFFIFRNVKNIPFTPKKVADLICKIDFSKLANFRIRIEPKKAEKPECYGYWDEEEFWNDKGGKCRNCVFEFKCHNVKNQHLMKD